MAANIDWSGSSGGVWARRWRETDRALAPVGEALDRAIDRHLPDRAFRALDVGCGPGTTSLSLARRRRDGSVVGCDISDSLIEIARDRAEDLPNVHFVLADAEQAARDHAPFDIIASRHGVMFFSDPARAFRTFRGATAPGGALVFSCFQQWSANDWAAELGSAAAGKLLPAPGREPSGFALADVGYVRSLLEAAGWAEGEVKPLRFGYVAGEGARAVDNATSFFAEIGPSARALEDLPNAEREAGLARLRTTIERHEHGGQVTFEAAAWIWTAKAR